VIYIDMGRERVIGEERRGKERLYQTYFNA